MMQALDIETGLTLAADKARRGERYLCPDCGALVSLRLGLRKVSHFAHSAMSQCRLAEPESPRHRALKQLCKSFFAPLRVDWEVAVGERRVDALVDGKFVVECQCSPLSSGEWQARSASHHRAGFPVLWLWDVKRLCRKNTLEEALLLERHGRCVVVPPELRLCHDESKDLLFVADRHDILPCGLLPLNSGEQAAARKRGSPAALFWPHALRKLAFFPDFDKGARFHFPSRSRKLRLVRLGCPRDHGLEAGIQPTVDGCGAIARLQ